MAQQDKKQDRASKSIKDGKDGFERLSQRSTPSMKHRYDFEVGYLVNSPCKNCSDRSNFPGCDETCDILDNIHTTLCNCISCTKHG